MDNINAARMPLWEHLNELRQAIVRSLIVLSVVTMGTYNFADKILKFLELPVLNALPKDAQRLYFTGITDKFMVYLKASIYSAIFLSAPYLLWELWRFVSPGLYKKEKRLVLPFVILGSLFFLLGVAFAYYLVIPQAYQFLVNYGSPAEVPLITLGEYFSTTLQLLLLMGIVCELPVVLMILSRFGIIEKSFLRKWRGHAYVALAVLTAFITPTPDAFTMLLVLLPLCLLYELSYWLVGFAARRSV